jgi:cation transport regulator ChaC
VTLVHEQDARCAGIAYQVDHSVFEHLDHREKNGYSRHRVALEAEANESLDAIVYIAPLDNHAYLGPAPLEAMVEQILASAGPSGTNRNYVFELADALRSLGAHDPHVYELEAAVRQRLKKGR